MNAHTNKEVVSVYQFLLHSLMQGHQISTNAVADQLEFDKAKIKLIIDFLAAEGAIYLEASNEHISAIYPFSVEPTHHRVRDPEGHIAYANCALDALTIPSIFHIPVKIESRCDACQRPININVDNTSIRSYEPTSIVVWEQKRISDAPAKISVCPGTNFFCRKSCAQQLHQTESEKQGSLLNLEEAIKRVQTWCTFRMYSKITGLLIEEVS